MRTAISYDHRGWYALLGVDPTATVDEIRRAYKSAARSWHPDVNPDPRATEVMQSLGEALHVLCDPLLRADYDATEAQVDHGVSWAPATVDFGQVTLGKDVRRHVNVTAEIPVSDVEFLCDSGPWWSSTVSVPDDGSAFMSLTVEARPTTPGPHTGELRFRVGLLDYAVPISATAVLPSRARRIARSSFNSLALRRLTTSLRRGAKWLFASRWDRWWTTDAAIFIRIGLFGALLYPLVATVLRDSGIPASILQADRTLLAARAHAIEPFVLWSTLALIVTTLGATRAPRILRFLATLCSVVGWITLVFIALVVVAYVVYITAILAAIAFALYVLFASD